MAKKSRRSRRRSTTKKSRRTTQATKPQAASKAQPAETSAAPPTTARTRKAKGVDFATEYAYVVSDLKRIAIIAAAMLAVLVGLSFVIQ